jgi:GntR family transcriptional regulator
MLLNLTDLSSEPLQSQISRQIRAKILTGELAAGEALPSIRALSRETRVSVITVQRGYEDLEREGLIHSRRGKGFFVSELGADRKREMARGRLTDQLEPIVRAAFAEGLKSDQILKAVSAMVSRQGEPLGRDAGNSGDGSSNSENQGAQS